MGDLISRRAVINAVMDLPDCPNGYSDTYDKACIIGLLEEVPSVDAVEVVRCKDCKHRCFDRFGFMCNLDTGDPYETGRNAYADDWFCADGKRKDG